MKDDWPRTFVRQITKKRRIIETKSDGIHIEKVSARDIWRLTVRVGRKLRAHTVGCYLKHELGNPVLKLEMIMP